MAERPELPSSAYKIGMSGDYANMRLCGAWAMDRSTATTFYLQDQRAGRWHKPFLDALGINEEKLPELLPVGTVIGRVSPEASALTKLPAGAAVVLGSFDHPSAARGIGAVSEGRLMLSCGSSWVGFAPIADRERIISMNLLTDPFLRDSGGCWAGYFALTGIGRAIDGYIRRLLPGAKDPYAGFEALAANSPQGAGGLTINPNDAPDGGLIASRPNDVARALMEGAAKLFAVKLDELRKGGVPVTETVMVGGAALSGIWPGIVSQATGVPVVPHPAALYAGAVGAATIALENVSEA